MYNYTGLKHLRGFLVPPVVFICAALSILANAPAPMVTYVVRADNPAVKKGSISESFEMKGEMYQNYHKPSYFIDTNNREYDVSNITVEVHYADRSGKKRVVSFNAQGNGKAFAVKIEKEKISGADFPLPVTFRFFGDYKGQRKEFFPNLK